MRVTAHRMLAIGFVGSNPQVLFVVAAIWIGMKIYKSSEVKKLVAKQDADAPSTCAGLVSRSWESGPIQMVRWSAVDRCNRTDRCGAALSTVSPVSAGGQTQGWDCLA